MAVPSILQGNRISAATLTTGNQILGNNFSAGGNNVFNINNAPSTEAMDRKKCIRSLFVSDPADDRAKYISFKGQVVSLAFAWITKTKAYKSWLDKSTGSQLLWLSGGPGTGKTMFSIFLTEQLEKLQKGKQLILYYFCEGRDPKRNSPVNVLRGLIYTLVQQKPPLMKYILPDFEVQEEALFGQDAIEPLWRILVRMINDPETGPVYCVIDGLDECSQTSTEQLEHILKKFKIFYKDQTPRSSDLDVLSRDFGQMAVSSSHAGASHTSSDNGKSASLERPVFKLALVSREEPLCLPRELMDFGRVQLGVETNSEQRKATPILSRTNDIDSTTNGATPMSLDSALAGTPKNEAHTKISGDEGTDIIGYAESLSIYIQTRTTDLAQTKGYSEEFAQALQQSLQQRGDGTFLWVDMAIEQLSKAALNDSEQALTNLPGGREGMYCLSLLQIPPDIAPVAAFVLRWITTAFRPLKLEELSALLCFLNGQEKGPQLDTVQQAIDCCGALLDVSDDREVKLGHQTAKDFLTGTASQPSPLLADPRLAKFHVNENSTHGEIAQTSISYLEKSCFSMGWFHIISAGTDHWTKNKVEPSESVMEEYPFLQYSALYWPEHMKKGTPGTVDLSSPFFSPGNIIRKNWFKSAWGAAMRRDGEQAPSSQSKLHIAAFFDIKELAESLSHASDFHLRLDKRNMNGETPLFVAASRGSIEVFAFLLDLGAKQTCLGTPILYLACEGQLNIVKLLLDRGVDVNHIPEDNAAVKALRYTPKSWVKGITAISKYLDETGKQDLEVLQGSLQDYGLNVSALQWATIRGQEDIARFLLERGADTQYATTHGWTAINFAIWAGEPALIELIIQYGGSLGTLTKENWTLLHCTARRGKVAAAEYLLEHNLHVDATSTQRETPLHLSSYYGHDETAKILVSRGANVEARTSKGFTPLHLAAAEGHDKVLKILLEHGADRNALSNNKETPLKIAKGGRNSMTARLLNTYRPQLVSQHSAPAVLPSPTPMITTIGASPESPIPPIHIVHMPSQPSMGNPTTYGQPPGPIPGFTGVPTINSSPAFASFTQPAYSPEQLTTHNLLTPQPTPYYPQPNASHPTPTLTYPQTPSAPSPIMPAPRPLTPSYHPPQSSSAPPQFYHIPQYNPQQQGGSSYHPIQPHIPIPNPNIGGDGMSTQNHFSTQQLAQYPGMYTQSATQSHISPQSNYQQYSTFPQSLPIQHNPGHQSNVSFQPMPPNPQPNLQYGSQVQQHQPSNISYNGTTYTSSQIPPYGSPQQHNSYPFTSSMPAFAPPPTVATLRSKKSGLLNSLTQTFR